jgi:hypothetical protein
MWQVLDIVARLILLGGVVLIVWWLWQILSSAPARSCVACNSALSEHDLAMCYRCLYPATARQNNLGGN